MNSTSLILGFVVVVLTVTLFTACQKMTKNKTDKEVFDKILNDPRVNSKEVGESEGITYFQVLKDGKTGFRDLDGNITIEPIYESAEMFSEGLSAVQLKVNGKWGYINTKGETVIKPQFDYAGSFHNELADFRVDDLCGFINKAGQVVIKPQFHWTDEFSEGLCVVSTAWKTRETRKYGFIDTTGKLIIDYQYQHATKFENGQAKIQVDNKWGAIDKDGTIIVEPIHPDAKF